MNHHKFGIVIISLILFTLGITGISCEKTKTGATGATGTNGLPGPDNPVSAVIQPGEDLPGLIIAITGLSGGTGTGGVENFKAGDSMSVTFTIKTNDGRYIPISDLDHCQIVVAGPTTGNHPTISNLKIGYQQTLISPGGGPSAVISKATQNTDKSWTYTFPGPIPTTYPAPPNDTTSFGLDHGELQGQNLIDGTYTVGVIAFRDYTVSGFANPLRDAGNVTYNFLMGSATTIETREIVKDDNCNQCHVSIRAHGGFRRGVKMCVLCHTAGAEDKNVATVEGGTPGRTIEFSIMIHKIHNGKNLPSVNGKINSNATIVYDPAQAKPLKYVGYKNVVSDFSKVQYPIMPNLIEGMPVDKGYSSLSSTNQGIEGMIQKGVTNCDSCHGDPDGAGPLTAPAQGTQAYINQSRYSCGSCHDDMDDPSDSNAWGTTYPGALGILANHSGDIDDSQCFVCHDTTGTFPATDVEAAHTHPLLKSASNPISTYTFNIISLAGGSGTSGQFQAGDTLTMEFSLKDPGGVDIAPTTFSSISVPMSGPKKNRNILLRTSIPTAALGATAASYTVKVPTTVWYELVGTGTNGTTGEQFTATTTFWQGVDTTKTLTTSVIVITGKSGASSTLSVASVAGQNYVDVPSAATFAAGDFVVIEDGVVNKEEYAYIGYVEDKTTFKRVWFTSEIQRTAGGAPDLFSIKPSLQYSHTVGRPIERVTATPYKETTDYILDKPNNRIQEGPTDFASGKVLLTYGVDYKFPTTYPIPINSYLQFDEAHGSWFGKTLEDGTYTIGMYASKGIFLDVTGAPSSPGPDKTRYNVPVQAGAKDFLVGSATSLNTTNIISSPDNCNACHSQMAFHGNTRRDYKLCIICHGTAGGEDRPLYIFGFFKPGTLPSIPPSPSPPFNITPPTNTPNATIEFRDMLHRIHRGKNQANKATYQIIGWQNKSTKFEDAGFPAMPGATKHCNACHGSGSTSWKEPAPRVHSAGQTKPILIWRVACLSCHDGPAVAHADLNTSPSGYEACFVCHSQTSGLSVELKHKNQ